MFHKKNNKGIIGFIALFLTALVSIGFYVDSLDLENKELGAPIQNVVRNLVPETDSAFYLGTTTPSTKAWRGLIADEVCLTADTCKTAWPTGSTPAGSDGAVQYNNGGSLGGFGSYNDSTNLLTLSGQSFTIADVTATAISIVYGSGNYYNSGYSTQGRIWAYKDTAYGRVHSSNYFQTSIVTDNGAEDSSYQVRFNITPVSGADGYIIELQDTYDGLTFGSGGTGTGVDTGVADYYYNGDDYSGITYTPTILYSPSLALNGSASGTKLTLNAGDSTTQALSVTGTSNFTGAMSLTGSLSVTGGITASSNIQSSGTLIGSGLTATTGTITTGTVTNLTSTTGAISTLTGTTANFATSMTAPTAVIGGFTYNSSGIAFNANNFTLSNTAGNIFKFQATGGANTTTNGASPNSPGSLSFFGTNGGAATGVGALTNSGGSGPSMAFASGVGGAASQSTGTNTAGNGGGWIGSSGAGGVAAGTSATTNQSGSGGSITFQSGNGGVSTTSGGANNRGGDGGGVTFVSGAGGSASNGSVTNVAGRGGDFSISSAEGGTATGTGATGGRGGFLTLSGGNGGTNANGGDTFISGGVKNGTGRDGNTYLGVVSGGSARGSVVVGINTSATYTARLHVESLTEQIRTAYNSSNYFSTTVGSTGGVTFDAVGAGAGFTFSDNLALSGQTASRLAGFDANKNIISLDTATYPSLTELTYLKGVTSSIQTQLDSKGSGTVTSVSGTTNRITSTGGTTPVIDISASYVGQSSITTLGTIGTGVWQGTAIGDSYISSASTWNAKENALTFSAPLSRSVNTISIPVATSLANGYLSSTDWSTFNGKEAALTFSTGLTRTTNTITVNTTQNITKLSNLTSNGFVKTSGGDGTLSVDTNTYLTGNQTITLSGDVTGSGTTAITATIANLAVTNAKINDVAWSKVSGTPTTLSGYGITNAVDGTGTANELPYWVDSNTLGTLTIATYPSLTELSYVKGLTSSAQSQISALVSDTAFGTSWDGVTTIAPSKNAIYDVMPYSVMATGETITSTTLANIGGLSVPVVAGTYLVQAEVHGQSSTTAGYTLGINHSGTTTSIEGNQAGQLSTTTWGATARITAVNTSSTVLGTTANVETKAILTAKIVVSTSGNITIQGRKVTSGNFIVRGSSWLKVTKIA